MVWYEIVAAFLGLVFGSYALVWSVPGVIMNAVVCLGSLKHIIFIDQQLAKELDKYYDHNGYMRPRYQLSWEIGSRCFDYWVKYPFIRKRATTDSTKFKIFMWVNALGMWSWIIVIICLVVLKLTGYMP